MKKKLLSIILMLSKYFIYISLIHLVTFSFLFAKEGVGQGKSEINVWVKKIDLRIQNASIEEVFNMIEGATEYKFAYDESLAESVLTKISLEGKNKPVADYLLEISKETKLKFKQVNQTITVRKMESKIWKRQPVLEIAVQQKKISGIVTSADDSAPLPGVSIIIKGTSSGTTTDLDGKFALEVAEGAVLQFSYIGYETQEVAVGTQTTFEIALITDLAQLEEVIVVGYGTKSKKTLTGSVSNIDGEELLKTPSFNVSANLQGKLPGLTSNQRTGEPGRDDPSLLIRGQGTFGNNTPLVIIDGVPRSNISRLNPEDIENISVLKDASAAIYGARAANGVILVTTKKGKSGKPKFNFSYNSAWSTPTHVPDMLGSPEYAETYNEGEWYAQGRPDDADFSPYFTDDEIQKFRDGSDPILYPNTDWVEETMKSSALQQRVSLSATGGTDKVRYLLSFAYMDQDGHWKNNPTRYQQYNMRANIDVDLTKNLTVGANLSGMVNKKKYSSEGTFVNFYNITRSIPTMVAQYPNGLIAPGRFVQNPLLIDRRGHTLIDETPIYTTFTASYKIPGVKGLRLDGSYNYDFSNQTEKTWRTPWDAHEYNVNTGEYDVVAGDLTAPELTDRYDKWTTAMWNYRLVYEKSFGSHNITAMLGQEQQKNTSSWVRAFRRNYVSSAIDEINVGSTAAEDKDNGGTSGASAYNNYFGRLNYDFNQKYMVELLFRYDGSQVFPEGKRYGFFPGISAGWRMSEEPFMKNNLTFVDNLKLRFSYGEIGNDRVGQWQYLQSYSFGNNYVFGTSDVPGVYPNTLPNPNITWEVSKKTDIGLETALWNNLLKMDLTFWKENRSNILASRNLSIPEILGFPGLPNENIGEVDGKGFELVLGHQKTFNDFSYFIDGNVAYAESKVVFMDETPNTEAYQDQTGKPIGAELFYVADGIFNTQAELDAYPHNGNSGLGDIKIVDQNGDGEINDQDRVRWDKTVTPKWVYGLTLGFEYKNFDLNVFFQGQAGAVNWARRFADLAIRNEFANAFTERAEDRWTVDNPNGTMPRSNHNNIGQSTFFLYDASFIRLKTTELGYTLPKELVSKINLESARFYVSGFNLLTWAKEIKYTDPEVSGQEIYYPPLRVLNLGVNVKF
ncbi:TonB-dependent receptor [Flammeovirgaceae bacterium SG7u.111]|nr:TonB-dependent receptor [Flammeovirgaceae bacterium SG7u.132]WPO35024.1 TonB-dependent receptor [Flammeovirgaceae bacterium SG7u.111]